MNVMGASIAAAPRRREVPDGDRQGTLGLIGEARATGAPTWTPDHAEKAAWLLKILDRAMDRTAQRKVITETLGIDKSLLRRQLDGDGHLSVARLGLLGDVFWLAVADELRIHFGMLDRAELIAQAEALSDRARQLFAQAAQR